MIRIYNIHIHIYVRTIYNLYICLHYSFPHASTCLFFCFAYLLFDRYIYMHIHIDMCVFRFQINRTIFLPLLHFSLSLSLLFHPLSKTASVPKITFLTPLPGPPFFSSLQRNQVLRMSHLAGQQKKNKKRTKKLKQFKEQSPGVEIKPARGIHT